MFAESDAYERFMGRWSRHLAPLFVQFAGVGRDESVLDVGSGTGVLATAVAEAVPSARVIGVDRSAAYVSYSKEHVPNDRVSFVVGDAQALQWADGTFDRSLSLLVLNFIPDPTRALLEMVRVTRPGGVVAAAVWDYSDGMQMLRIFWDEAVVSDPTIAARNEALMPFCRAGELAALWARCGLVHVDEQPLTIQMAFGSFEDYWTPFLGGQGPAGAYGASLPEAERAVLRLRLRRRLVGDDDRVFTLPARAWAVRGTVPGFTRLP